MRVLGIEVAGSDTLLVILDGTPTAFRIELLSPSRLLLPADPEPINRLIALKKQIYDLLKSTGVQYIGVIRADVGCSTTRAKVECVIQMAALEAGTRCTLIPSQTVAAAEKRKVNEIAGEELENTLTEVRPGYLRKAAYCAWSVINGKQ